MTERKQYCSFYVGGMFFGVDVCVVQEMIRYQEMTRVPLAAPEVSGLINLRGQIVSAIDLRRRLGLPDRADGSLPMNVVARTPDGVVSLLVDEIADVLNVEDELFEPTPQTLSGITRELIDGVYKLKGKLLLIMDPVKASNIAATAAAA
jgi:purine-binding chemotaxis protein CheW